MARGLRLFGHPLHAVLSDFPVALLGTSLFWDGDGVGLWRHEGLWWAISFWSIALGLLASCAAAAAGMIDYVAIPEGNPAVKTGMWHMLLMGSAVCVYGTSLLVRGGVAMPAGHALIAALALEGLGLLLLSLGGWFGGHLVFFHGVGRD